MFMPPELVPPITAGIRVVEVTGDGVVEAKGKPAAGLDISPLPIRVWP
jgi:hypothetical protein